MGKIEKLSKEKVSALVSTKWSRFIEQNTELIDMLSKLEPGEGVFAQDVQIEQSSIKRYTVAVQEYSGNIFIFGTRRIGDEGWVIFRKEEKPLVKKAELETKDEHENI